MFRCMIRAWLSKCYRSYSAYWKHTGNYARIIQLNFPNEDSTQYYVYSEQPSIASISSNYDIGVDKDRVIESSAVIYNASANFNVSMSIKGFSSGLSREFLMRRRHKFIKSRSVAMICDVRTERHRQRNRTLEFGMRTENDILVQTEKYHTHDPPEYPSHKFSFFNGSVDINYVKLTYDVSCHQCSPIKLKWRNMNMSRQFMARITAASLPNWKFMERKYDILSPYWTEILWTRIIKDWLKTSNQQKNTLRCFGLKTIRVICWSRSGTIYTWHLTIKKLLTRTNSQLNIQRTMSDVLIAQQHCVDRRE